MSDEQTDQQGTLERNRTLARRKLILSSVLGVVALSALAHHWPKRWRYIVIHHSAGNYGTIEFLQRVHRQRQYLDPVDAIPYHYIIGNGNGLENGEIARDWRGKWHIWGAHVSSRNPSRNYYGLGICLVGNFEQSPPSEKQYQALLGLTRELMDRYDIPVENISGHGHTPGERTLCPGKYFPMDRLLSDVQIRV